MRARLGQGSRQAGGLGSPRRPSFIRAAQRRGVRRSVARALEPAALELFPNNPVEVLNTRESFERAAAQAVLGDASNLELSYRSVDAFATALESLGLARATDVPDPFRRVWLTGSEGTRLRGVVLRCERGEVAVFCPASHERFAPAGPIFKMSYRGDASSVEFELKLCDAVRLPEALVVHLSRPENGGAIGRTSLRVEVRQASQVCALGDVEPISWREPQGCEILDVSAGGLRIASDLPFGVDQEVSIQVPIASTIGDDSDECLRPPPGDWLSLTAKICWNRTDESGQRTQGLLIVDTSTEESSQYLAFVTELLERSASASGSAPIALLVDAPETQPRGPRSLAAPTPNVALEVDVAGEIVEADEPATSSGEALHGESLASHESKWSIDAPDLVAVPAEPEPGSAASPGEDQGPPPSLGTMAQVEGPSVQLDPEHVEPMGESRDAMPDPLETPGFGEATEIVGQAEILSVADDTLARAAQLAERVSALEHELAAQGARAELCDREEHVPRLGYYAEEVRRQAEDLERAWEYARAAERRADAQADELHVCRQRLEERKVTIDQATQFIARLKPMLGAIHGELLEVPNSPSATELRDIPGE